MILLNITALILIFIHTFLHPTFLHPTFPSPTSYIDKTDQQTTTTAGAVVEPEVIIVNNCTSCDCTKGSSTPEVLDSALAPLSLSRTAVQEQERIVEKNFLEHVEKIKMRFIEHPGHSLDKSMPLEDYMSHLSKRKECHLKPIFITMARVSSELYWQLIENYFYTM
jgi:hypothetical protein